MSLHTRLRETLMKIQRSWWLKPYPTHLVVDRQFKPIGVLSLSSIFTYYQSSYKPRTIYLEPQSETYEYHSITAPQCREDDARITTLGFQFLTRTVLIFSEGLTESLQKDHRFYPITHPLPSPFVLLFICYLENLEDFYGRGSNKAVELAFRMSTGKEKQ